MNAVAQAATPDVSEIPAPLVLTDNTTDKVKQLIEEESNPELKLRVFMQGGGCSGFRYSFTFNEETNEDDATIAENGVPLLIDSMSYQYLMGTEIDYKEDINNAQLVIENPNASTTCGCGSSFLVWHLPRLKEEVHFDALFCCPQNGCSSGVDRAKDTSAWCACRGVQITVGAKHTLAHEPCESERFCLMRGHAERIGRDDSNARQLLPNTCHQCTTACAAAADEQ